MRNAALREGDQNEYVKRMQQMLVDLSYDPGDIDGQFGRRTTWAVKWFQHKNNLRVDGVCGKNTLAKLADSEAVPGVSEVYKNWSYGLEPLYYYMNDSRWKTYPYDAARTSKTETVGSTGCGPTTMASIVTNLLGKAVLPPVLCDWSNDHGYRDPEGVDGTSPTFFTKCAAAYGLRSATITISGRNPLELDHFSLIQEVLRANSLVACSVNGNSPYTNGGHYIMIWKIENDKVYIKDPVRKNNALQAFSVREWIEGRWVKRFIRIGK